jgi:putative SOS response-associated peptidase YedK
MCGRYVSPEQAAIERAWEIGRRNQPGLLTPEQSDDLFGRAHFNVAPTTLVPILRIDTDDGTRVLDVARWGLIPHWWSKREMPRNTFNARSEEAAVKPMWRHAWRHTRCLLPALGWYEWTDGQRIDPRTGKPRIYRQPYYIHREDGEPLAFAGLYSYAPRDAAPMLSCAVVTMGALGRLVEVHERMPAVLPAQLHDAWLDPSVTEAATVDRLIAGADVGGLMFHPVDTRVNVGRGDDSGMIARVELPSIG